MKNRHVRITVVSLIAIVTLGFVFYVATPAALTRPVTQTLPSPTTIPVSLSIAGVMQTEEQRIAEGSSALDLLRSAAKTHAIEIATKDYAGMGTLVEKIGPLKNGTGGDYWTYYVNGQFAQVGADSYIVKPGDSIEWKFEVPKE